MVAFAGLNRTLDVIELFAGAFYVFSLLLNAESWCAKNLKAKAGADTIYLTKMCGAICLGLRLCVHHTRTVGGGADLNGIKLDYIAGGTWGLCAWLNHENEGLFTEDGKMNKMICAAFAAAYFAAGAGVLPAF